ncbi:MAG: hypothetical protein Q9227_000755 [Pyrenula ochraceoflavens]
MARIEQGQLAPASYNAGYIVLSYIVSLVGCITTLELLHRRTSRLGLYNWYLLITSSITMGGVGIWCMHFIGNRAVVLAHGQPEFQIVYSPGFTAVSFFLPIAVLMAAFYILGGSDKASKYYIALSGILAGLAICGMHYVGQLGISNYKCSYNVAHVVGAAVIAVFASLVALSVFFRLRATWTNSWWKRALCGAIMGCAVSGMHWTATVGTYYKSKGVASTDSDMLSRNQTVIVCTVLSCASCVLLLIFAFIANRSRKRSRNRAQQLVLACAYFDEMGRIMVTPEGLLPSRKITNHYVEKTFGAEEFSRTHPAFLWVFRATRNWPTLNDLIGGMKHHLVSNPAARHYCPGSGGARDEDVDLDLDFSIVFKELFCVAAQDLAQQIHQPLDKLGVLYEEPMSTGSNPVALTKAQRRLMVNSVKGDVESNDIPYYFGRGQFLFVTQQINKQEVNHFAANGFRFAAIPQIAEILAKNMQTSTQDMQIRLENMLAYSQTENLMRPGVHVTCFMLRPNVRKGFDVLVDRSKPNQLPSVQLPFDALSQWQAEILRKMDNWTVQGMLKILKNDTSYTMKYEQEFCQDFYRALSKLVDMVEDPSVMQARFSARRIMAPCQSQGRGSPPGKCTLLPIRFINNLQARGANDNLDYVPLRFFNAQQQVYTGIADHESFAHQIHREFAHCIDLSQKANLFSRGEDKRATPVLTPLYPTARTRSWFRGADRKSSVVRRDGSTAEKPLVSNPAFGGIMVSNQVSVDISELQTRGSESSLEMNEMGTVGEAGVASTDMNTFVDELFALCRV